MKATINILHNDVLSYIGSFCSFGTLESFCEAVKDIGQVDKTFAKKLYLERHSNDLLECLCEECIHNLCDLSDDEVLIGSTDYKTEDNSEVFEKNMKQIMMKFSGENMRLNRIAFFRCLRYIFKNQWVLKEHKAMSNVVRDKLNGLGESNNDFENVCDIFYFTLIVLNEE